MKRAVGGESAGAKMMLIITIRKLVRLRLAGSFARFWEGALGNASYGTSSPTPQARPDEDGYIHSVPAHKLLDAMQEGHDGPRSYPVEDRRREVDSPWRARQVRPAPALLHAEPAEESQNLSGLQKTP